MPGLDFMSLPQEAQDEFNILEVELAEGDITQKGYEKKKQSLISKYGLDSVKQDQSPSLGDRRMSSILELKAGSLASVEHVMKAFETSITPPPAITNTQAKMAQDDSQARVSELPLQQSTVPEKPAKLKKKQFNDKTLMVRSLLPKQQLTGNSNNNNEEQLEWPQRRAKLPESIQKRQQDSEDINLQQMQSSLSQIYSRPTAYNIFGGSSYSLKSVQSFSAPETPTNGEAQQSLSVKLPTPSPLASKGGSIVSSSSHHSLDADQRSPSISSIEQLDKATGGSHGDKLVQFVNKPEVQHRKFDQFGTISRKLVNIMANKAPKQQVQKQRLQPLSQPASPVDASSFVDRKVAIKSKDANIDQDLSSFKSLAQILRARSMSDGKQVAFAYVDHKGKEHNQLTFEKLYGRVLKVASVLTEKYQLKRQEKVALLFRKGELAEFVVSMAACSAINIVAVPIVSNPYSDQVVELLSIMKENDCKVMLTTDSDYRILSKELAHRKLKFPSSIYVMKTNEYGSITGKKAQQFIIDLPQQDDIFYIEYGVSAFGNLNGVLIPHKTIMWQALMLKAQNQLQPKDVFINYLDYRQGPGMIMGIFLPGFCGSSSFSVSSSLDEASELLLMQLCKKHHGTVVLCNSVYLEHLLVLLDSQTADQLKRISKADLGKSLNSVKLLAICDPSPYVRPIVNLQKNIIKAFGQFQFPKDANLTPVSSISEIGGLVVAMRTVEDKNVDSTPLGIALSSLDFDIIKQYDGSDCIKVSDSGCILPGLRCAIVDTSEDCNKVVSEMRVGELWVSGDCLPFAFYKNSVATTHTFNAQMAFSAAEGNFTRTGLYGFMKDGNFYSIGCVGERMELMDSDGAPRHHYSFDINQAVVKSFGVVQQCVSFPIYLNDEELCVIVCEVSTHTGKIELQSYGTKIADFLRQQCNINVYLVVFCAQKSLPCNVDKSVNVHQTRKMIDVGLLDIIVFHLNLENSVQRLPKFLGQFGDDDEDELAIQVDNPQQRLGKVMQSRFASSTQYQVCDGNAAGSIGKGKGTLDVESGQDLLEFESISRLLIWRIEKQPKSIAFQLVDHKGKEVRSITYQKISEKVARIAALFEKKNFNGDTKLLLFYQPGLDFAVALHACLYYGVVPVVITVPAQVDRLLQIVPLIIDVLKSYNVAGILSNDEGIDTIKSRAFQQCLKSNFGSLGEKDSFQLPELINTSLCPKVLKTMDAAYHRNAAYALSEKKYALLHIQIVDDTSYNATGLSHDTIMAQCTILKEFLNLKASEVICCSTELNDTLSLLYSSLAGIYVGYVTSYYPLKDFAQHPQSWLELQHKVSSTNAFLTQPMLRKLQKSCIQIKINSKPVEIYNLRNIQTILTDRAPLTSNSQSSQSLRPFELDMDAVASTLVDCVNPFLASRSFINADQQQLFLRMKSLAGGRLEFGEHGEYDCIQLLDVGRVLPCSAVAVCSIGTQEICLPGTFGEVYIQSPANADVVYKHYQLDGGDSKDTLHSDVTLNLPSHFGLEGEGFINTGFIGFLQPASIPCFKTSAITLIDSHVLVIIGRADDMIALDVIDHGRQATRYYFPRDLELSVERSHHCVKQAAAISSQFLSKPVIVVELENADKYGPGCVPVIVNALLDDFQLVPSKIVFVAIDSIPKNRNGSDKDRNKVKELFESGGLVYHSTHTITNE
ncbi:hypothetical protein MIR68_000521 [Amoeboaphelidium protococcarum]|nr:hypothetical protein MIR68_000521 [Amoeboaphelidium protococcarum]